jgi:hypothetical protein
LENEGTGSKSSSILQAKWYGRKEWRRRRNREGRRRRRNESEIKERSFENEQRCGQFKCRSSGVREEVYTFNGL